MAAREAFTHAAIFRIKERMENCEAQARIEKVKSLWYSLIVSTKPKETNSMFALSMVQKAL